jgi:hypothetical protein
MTMVLDRDIPAALKNIRVNMVWMWRVVCGGVVCVWCGVWCGVCGVVCVWCGVVCGVCGCGVCGVVWCGGVCGVVWWCVCGVCGGCVVWCGVCVGCGVGCVVCGVACTQPQHHHLQQNE